MTLSESPFSSMYLMTAASSAPGWSQTAGTPVALACSRTPRVTYVYHDHLSGYKFDHGVYENTEPLVV